MHHQPDAGVDQDNRGLGLFSTQTPDPTPTPTSLIYRAMRTRFPSLAAGLLVFLSMVACGSRKDAANGKDGKGGPKP